MNESSHDGPDSNRQRGCQHKVCCSSKTDIHEGKQISWESTLWEHLGGMGGVRQVQNPSRKKEVREQFEQNKGGDGMTHEQRSDSYYECQMGYLLRDK